MWTAEEGEQPSKARAACRARPTPACAVPVRCQGAGGPGGCNLIAEGGFGFWFPHSSYLRVQRRGTGHLRLRKLRRIHASFEFAGRSQKRRQTDAVRKLVECTVVRSFDRGDQELFATCSQ